MVGRPLSFWLSAYLQVRNVSGRIDVKHMDIPTFKQTNTVGNMYSTSRKIFMTIDFTSLTPVMKSYESLLALAVFVRSYLQAKPAKPSLATKASLESL